MAKITFACPKCGGKLSINQHATGMNVSCPRCAQAVVVPPPAPKKDSRRPTAPGWYISGTSLVFGTLGLLLAYRCYLFTLSFRSKGFAEGDPARDMVYGLVALYLLVAGIPTLVCICTGITAIIREARRTLPCVATVIGLLSAALMIYGFIKGD